MSSWLLASSSSSIYYCIIIEQNNIPDTMSEDGDVFNEVEKEVTGMKIVPAEKE